MKFKIFTLHPDIFTSFVSNSLIARAISKQIIEIKTIDWRQDFGIGNYKQVDDKPFGGGSGMVLMADPIINAMISEDCFDRGECPHPTSPTAEEQINPLPNNSKFYEQIKSEQIKTKKVNVLMTPRGFPMTQQVVEWLTQDFEELNILCGRYEGFDARINDHIDLELSIGNFVLNGGEVGSMCLVEAVSRLVPDFITKNTSVLHDSFSSGLNNYNEFEFTNSKPQYQRELEKSKNSEKLKTKSEKLGKNISSDRHSERLSEESHASMGNESNLKFPLSRGWQPQVDGGNIIYNSGINDSNLFNNTHWLQNILPHIEHPQYTRPNIWQDPITNEQKKVPEVLLSGDHAKIQKWRVKWW
jgi:tRNA (guanine37-N1)-methyltransferase